MEFTIPLYGGTLIGVASLIMLLFNGRILGVSGILGGIIGAKKNDLGWRVAFLLGIFAGGFLIAQILPEAFEITVPRSNLTLIIAGLLVGFGTRMGSGCTSGHGVCGVSRFSPRSILATCTFMGAGILTVFITIHLLKVNL